MLKKVCCYNIVYSARESIISVVGADALDAFINRGLVTRYSAEEAPKSLEIEVDLPDNWIDDLYASEQRIKEKLESESGLTIEHFDYSVRF